MTDLPKILGLAFLLLASGVALADGKLFRWTDKDGHVHYSDQPAANATEVIPKGAPGAAAPASGGSASPRSAAGSTQTAATDCENKKDQLTSYRKAAKITETNGLGETRDYNDEQRKKLIDTAEQAVRDACAGT